MKSSADGRFWVRWLIYDIPSNNLAPPRPSPALCKHTNTGPAAQSQKSLWSINREIKHIKSTPAGFDLDAPVKHAPKA